jgi:hypothetical protein
MSPIPPACFSPDGHRISHQDHYSVSTSWSQDDFGRSGISPIIEPKVKVKHETNMRKVQFYAFPVCFHTEFLSRICYATTRKVAGSNPYEVN